MDWSKLRRSRNVEDRRGQRVQRHAGSAARSLLPFLLSGRFGRYGILLAVGFVAYIYFADDSVSPSRQVSTEVSPDGDSDPQLDMVRAILGQTEDTWTKKFAQEGRIYEQPRLVLFDRYVNSACGGAPSAVGPFYCPGDKTVYLDLSFFGELASRFGAAGDFPSAYVIAHEVGHHLQTLLGVSQRVQSLKQNRPSREVNNLSVRQELQADCFAGIWAADARQIEDFVEEGDIDEAINAAAAIGDDTLQERGRGVVRPETFTHGTSAQRVGWFKRGLAAEDLSDCDTFTDISH